MCNQRNPFRCIIPPQMINKLSKKNAKEKKSSDVEMTLENKFRAYRLRSDRKFFMSLSPLEKKYFATKKLGTISDKPKIEVYDLNHKYSLPGKLIKNPSVSKNNDAKRVYQFSRNVWDFYYNIFKRNSIDNLGMVMANSVHYGKIYKNAMWNGVQMVYGCGDKKYFASFTSDLDIVGHELTHGVIEYGCNLLYEHQSGALNESFADVFGMLVRQYANKEEARKSDWLIGKNIMIGKKFALRSMAEPGNAYRNHPTWGDDDQHATMDKYKHLPNTEAGDYGGVHIYSGIANYAFYRAAYEIGGYAWEKMGRIWYDVMAHKNLPDNATFKQAKAETIKSAIKFFKKGSLEEKAVREGWKAAKV